MPDAPIHIEKAEVQQFLRWLRDIEEAVGYINENIEEQPYECIDENIEHNARGFADNDGLYNPKLISKTKATAPAKPQVPGQNVRALPAR